MNIGHSWLRPVRGCYILNIEFSNYMSKPSTQHYSMTTHLKYVKCDLQQKKKVNLGPLTLEIGAEIIGHQSKYQDYVLNRNFCLTTILSTVSTKKALGFSKGVYINSFQ